MDGAQSVCTEYMMYCINTKCNISTEYCTIVHDVWLPDWGLFGKLLPHVRACFKGILFINSIDCYHSYVLLRFRLLVWVGLCVREEHLCQKVCGLSPFVLTGRVLWLFKKCFFNFGYANRPLGVNEGVVSCKGLDSLPGCIPASVGSGPIVTLTRINHLLKMNEWWFTTSAFSLFPVCGREFNWSVCMCGRSVTIHRNAKMWCARSAIY